MDRDAGADRPLSDGARARRRRIRLAAALLGLVAVALYVAFIAASVWSAS